MVFLFHKTELNIFDLNLEPRNGNSGTAYDKMWTININKSIHRIDHQRAAHYNEW